MTEIWWCEIHKTGSGNGFQNEWLICPAFALVNGETQECRMVQMRLVPADEVLSNPKPTTEGTR